MGSADETRLNCHCSFRVEAALTAVVSSALFNLRRPIRKRSASEGSTSGSKILRTHELLSANSLRLQTSLQIAGWQLSTTFQK